MKKASKKSEARKRAWTAYEKVLKEKYEGKVIGNFKIIRFLKERNDFGTRYVIIACAKCGKQRKVLFPQYSSKNFKRMYLNPNCCRGGVFKGVHHSFTCAISKFGYWGKSEKEQKAFLEACYPAWKKLHDQGKHVQIVKKKGKFSVKAYDRSVDQAKHFITINGEKRTFSWCAKQLGVSRQRVHQLFQAGKLRKRLLDHLKK